VAGEGRSRMGPGVRVSGGSHSWKGGGHGHGWYGGGWYRPWGFGGYGHGYWYPHHWSVWVGGPVYWGAGYGPYYGPYVSVYPYAYGAPPVYADAGPPVYRQKPGPAFQYYCTDPPGYYPDIPKCNTDWLQVVPRGTQPPPPRR
jgi:hypothetical protein